MRRYSIDAFFVFLMSNIIHKSSVFISTSNMIEKVKIISNCELVCVYEQMRKIIKKTFSRKKRKTNQIKKKD